MLGDKTVSLSAISINKVDVMKTKSDLANEQSKHFSLTSCFETQMTAKDLTVFLDSLAIVKCW